MAISFSRYVAITSGVGGGAAVRARDLILRLFTTSEKVPAKTVVEFSGATAAADVGSFFGLTSPEYLRAVFYFGFLSKLITAPAKLSFGRWANALTSAKIFGKLQGSGTLAQLNAVTTGSFKLTLGAYTQDVTAINLTGAANLAAVATLLQTAIRAVSGGGPAWTAATVTYDAPTNTFNLVSGATGVGAVAVAAAATGTPLAALLGWGSGAVFSPGVVAEEPLQSFIDSVEATDNFGTFAFIPALSQSQVTAVAAQNNTYNVKFLYSVGLALDTDIPTYYAALSGLSGVALTYTPVATEYDELLPAAVLAATDYGARNGTQNYMFQTAALSPKVTTNAQANALDAARGNYYGRTQTAGQSIDFYQRGVMCGLPTAPVDMNVYTNEMWLKDAAGAALMSLFLSLPKVSANAQGRAQMLAALQDPINRALFNGVISLGKPLNTTQRLYIGNLTGDANAWQQVYRIGYWVDVNLVSYVTTDGRTEWKAVYTLIYSKDDTVRKVEGSHVLI